MKTAVLRMGVPNGLLVLRDSQRRTYPDVDGVQNYWKSDTCLIVSCDVETDGETTVYVNRDVAGSGALKHLVDTTLSVPSLNLILEIVPGETIFELPLARPDVRLSVWTDGHHATQKVSIRAA